MASAVCSPEAMARKTPVLKTGSMKPAHRREHPARADEAGVAIAVVAVA